MSKASRKNRKAREAEYLRQMRKIHGPDYGKIKCDSCEKLFEVDKLIYGPDPFASEIYKDNTLVYLCDHCHYESHMDI